MVETLVDFFKGFPPELAVFIISMFPIVELRGGILAAALLKVDFLVAFPICILGNLAPMPIVLLFLDKIFAFLGRFKIFEKFLNWLNRKAEKNTEKAKKWKFWGLVVFVGIPLPGTGAWTGALVANAIKMRFKKSFPAVVAGVFMAGAIMSIICYALPDVFSALFL